MEKEITPLDALRALSAESQGFADFSTRTRALARAALARAEGRIDGIAEQALKDIDAKTAEYLAKHKAEGR